MNVHRDGPAGVAQQTRALLDLVEADRARQCAQILGDAQGRAQALRAQAHADARARLRQAFDEQRLLRRERIAAAQARLATRRRLHEQQHIAALLRLAWQQLPGELLALWKQADTRAQWVAQVLAWARARMPRGAWRIVHASEWSAGEQQALAKELAAELGAAPLLQADEGISAGLKVMADGNVIDGTLGGLLADRAEFEARLLRKLESTS
jgi:hypothetical protein